MPSGISQVAENGFGFSRCGSAENSNASSQGRARLHSRGEVALAVGLGWRSGSPVRLLHCFEYGFSRWGHGAASGKAAILRL